MAMPACDANPRRTRGPKDGVAALAIDDRHIRMLGLRTNAQQRLVTRHRLRLREAIPDVERGGVPATPESRGGITCNRESVRFFVPGAQCHVQY